MPGVGRHGMLCTVVNNILVNYQWHVNICNWGSYVRLAFMPNMLSSWNKVIIIIIIINYQNVREALKKTISKANQKCLSIFCLAPGLGLRNLVPDKSIYCCNRKLRCGAWLSRKKKSPKFSINHSQTARLLTGRTFKLTISPGIFERRAVTSPERLL